MRGRKGNIQKAVYMCEDGVLIVKQPKSALVIQSKEIYLEGLGWFTEQGKRLKKLAKSSGQFSIRSGLSRMYPAMCYEKWRHLLNKIQDTKSIVHRTMTPQPSSK